VTSFSIKGDRETAKALDALGKKASVNRVLRPSVRAALVPVNKAAKKAAKNLPKLKDSRSTGALSRSIGIRPAYTKKDGIFSQTVGSRGGFGVPDPVVKGRTRIPIFYALLVEKGTRTMEPRPYLGPAMTRNLGIVASTLRSRIATELPKEVAKQAAKAGSKK